MTTEIKTWAIQGNNLAIRVVFLAAVLSVVWAAPAVAQEHFDFDTGNAAGEVVVPAITPVILQRFAAGDAPLILRHTTLVNNAWFDAIAPYHETAVGVYSRINRRPSEERETHRERNIALLYASYRVLNSLQPASEQAWRAMLQSAGLDPDNNSTDTTTPVGIGNVAGNAIVAAREHDGMNQLGDEGECNNKHRGRHHRHRRPVPDDCDAEDRNYNRKPYADYLGYKPVNTAYEIHDAGRWQPDFVTNGGGIFRIQQFVTPQLRVTEPYTDINVSDFEAPEPKASNPRRRNEYRAQTDEVLDASANLTDEQKMLIELFDDKLLSLGASSFSASVAKGLSFDETLHYQFMVNVAAFDGAIVTWKEKNRHDAVRPFTAIRYLYGDQPLTAWGGPGQGTVTDITGNEWESYVPVADHPEYPSASACFCAAHSEASRLFLGDDTLGWSVETLVGNSRIEPGLTPASNVVLTFPTWTDFEIRCAESRFLGGMHFRAAIEESPKLCRPIGGKAFDFVQAHINGTAPVRDAAN